MRETRVNGFHAVCRECSQRLEHQEFSTIGMFLSPTAKCESCEKRLLTGPNSLEFFPVTDDQFVEISNTRSSNLPAKNEHQ